MSRFANAVIVAAGLSVAGMVGYPTAAQALDGSDSEQCTLLSCTVQAGWVCGSAATGYGMNFCNLVAGDDPFDLVCELV